MTSDDQYFLDQLGRVSSSIRKFSGDVFDASDKQLSDASNVVARYLNAVLPSSWSIRPPPIPQPPPAIQRSYLQLVQIWVSRHRAVTAALIGFLGTGAIGAMVLYSQSGAPSRKRRAKRAKNGARKEVIVIAGSPGSPIVKSLALDLERRGFLVYCIVASREEELIVQGESRPDIKPFSMDIRDPSSTHAAMERFYDVLVSPHQAFPGASTHELRFSGLILAPDLAYPSGSIEALSPEVWSDALNNKVLNIISITHSFLPTIKEFQARILILRPNIVHSLSPAYHSVESTVVGALDGFTKTLEREMRPSNVFVTQIRLGTFDFSAFVSRSHYAQQHFLASRSTSKASNLRELHHSVFDALTMKHPGRVRRVGRGSVVYDIIGSWTPASLVDLMLGEEKPSVPEVSRALLEENSQVWEKVERSNG